MHAGGWFYGDGHAFEVALQRLRDEQATIREATSKWDAKAFWSLYAPLIAASTPGQHGGARVKGTESTRTRVFANVDLALNAWAESLCSEVPSATKPFQSPGHVVEVALRNLMAQAQPGPTAAGEGATLDRASLVRRLQG